jgi:hypothetical protein
MATTDHPHMVTEVKVVGVVPELIILEDHKRLSADVWRSWF